MKFLHLSQEMHRFNLPLSFSRAYTLSLPKAGLKRALWPSCRHHPRPQGGRGKRNETRRLRLALYCLRLSGVACDASNRKGGEGSAAKNGVSVFSIPPKRKEKKRTKMKRNSAGLQLRVAHLRGPVLKSDTQNC